MGDASEHFLRPLHSLCLPQGVWTFAGKS